MFFLYCSHNFPKSNLKCIDGRKNVNNHDKLHLHAVYIINYNIKRI